MQGINTTLFKEHGVSYLLKNPASLTLGQTCGILKIICNYSLSNTSVACILSPPPRPLLPPLAVEIV